MLRSCTMLLWQLAGTLIETPGTGEMGTLPNELYEALKQLKKDPNFLFVPATGRVLADALTAMRNLPGVVVAFDGAARLYRIIPAFF
jgi:hydroxymethylpyrimidine pyrophosphatase-like HAD family hydrolase